MKRAAENANLVQADRDLFALKRTLRTSEIFSQEDHPGTHKTPTEIADELEISGRSMKRFIDEDLQVRPLKKIKVQ